MRLSKYTYSFALGLFCIFQTAQAQTVIFNNAGTTYTNTDGPTNDVYGPVDISNCTSISFSVNYNFSLPFIGAGNMESSTECPFGIPPCQGDPTDPSGGGCDQCWDFFYAQFQIDGANVNTQLVGVPGSLNQSGTLTFGPICTQNAATAGFIIQTQTWAANESITFSNLTITCWDGSPANLTVNPIPVCSGLPFTLSATLTQPTAVMGTLWSGPGTITSPNNLTTTVTGAPFGTNTYTFTATDDNACTSSSTIDVTVSAGASMDDPPNQMVCAGDPVAVVFTGMGNPDYNWTNSNPAIGLGASGMGDINFTAANVLAATTGTITVTPTENGCVGPPQMFTIVVNPLPSVNQPNNVTVCAGASINVPFTGTAGSTFNWTNDNTNIGLGASGVGNIIFNSANVVNQEVANITVIPIRNGCPGPPVTFTITINPSPTVVDPPNQFVCAGSPVDVMFSGTGNPTFNWTNSNVGIGLFPSGSGDISFTAANVVAITTGNITVTPNANGCPGPSQSFSITVNPLPVVNQPSSVAVCGGAPVSSLFTGTFGATFSWENNNTAIGLGASGIGNINFSSASVATQQVATITVTPIVGACPGDPVTFTITVNPAPVVMDPPNQSVCSGAPVVVAFSSTGSPTFNWTNSNIAIGLGSTGVGDINFTAANTPIALTGNLTVIPTENGCPGAPQNFTITVTPAPSMTTPSNVIACAGSTVNVLFAGTAGATFNWTNSNATIGLAASGNGNLNFIAAGVGTQQVATVTATPVIGTCFGSAVTFTIIIDPAPTVVDPPNQTICAGTPVTVTFSGTNNPTFNWTNDNTIIGLGASGSGNISFTAAGVDTGTITVTPVANGCPGASQTFDIIVVGSPVVTQPASLSACAGNPVSAVFSGTPGATFSWTNSNTATGLGASGIGDLGFTASGVLAVTTGNVSVTPSLGGCTGATQAFDININPLPTITLASIACSATLLTYDIVLSTTGDMLSASAGIVTGAAGNYAVSGIAVGTNVIITSTNTVTSCQFQQTVNAPNCNCIPVNTPTLPNNPTICEGTPTPPLSVTVDPGNTVDWYAAPSGGASLMLGSVSFIPTGSFTPGVYNFYAEAREVSTSCTSPTRILVTLTVNAVPSVVQIGDIVVCAGATVTVDFIGTASANMNWTNNNPGVGLAASGSGNISFPANFTGNNTLISVIPELNGCPGPLMSFFIIVNNLPVVVAPLSQTVCAGIAVAVNFSGTSGATFAWTNSETAIGLGANGSGDISFTTANVSSPTLANFSVTSSLAGCTGATQNFSITVNPAPSVTPPINQSACVGTAVAVVFSGTSGATFNWTNSNTAIGLGASGAGNINFTSTNAGFSPLMANIVVTPSQNGCVGIPQNFNLTINPPPSLMVVSTSCSTDLLTYSANVSSNATTLISSAGIVSGNFTISNIPNGMSIVLTASNAVTGCSQQQSVMAPSCTCPPIPAPNGANFPVICEGTATPALMVNAPAGITVDWYAAPTGGVPLLVGSSSFTPSGVFTAGSYTFYAESRDMSSNCTSALRTPVFLTVNAAPTMTQPIDQAVCAGFVISVGFNGSNGSLFNWTNSNSAIGLAANGAGNISFTATNTGSTPVIATISVTPSLFGCVGQPRTFTITVNPSPTMTDPMDVSACVGEAVALTFAATNAATFTWTNANTAIGLGATGMGNINFTTTSPGNALVTVIPTANGCAGTPQTFSITVLNNPNMNNPGNITSCAGGNVLVSFTGDPGLNYTWTNDNPAIGLSAGGMGNINFPASNNTGVETAQITVTPQLGACTGLPQTFSITINPAPVVSITGTAVICNGGTAMLTAIGGTNYSWNSGQTDATITVNPTSTTTYTVTASNNGCSATATATVSISPAIAVQATAVLAFGQYAISCTGANDATINASATGGSGAYQYTWSVAGQNSAILTDIGAGTYSLTVTDANQCTGASTAIVTEPPPLTFDIALSSVACGASAATALITPSGGTDPFSVLLDGVLAAGGLSPSIPGGQHLVEIMDANGCVADTMVGVILPVSPVISLPAEETVTLGETLVIEAQTNLSAWQSLVWTPQPDTSCIACLRQEWVPAISSAYEVVITDSSGCTATATIRVLVEKRLDIYIPNVFSPNLDGVNDFWTLDSGVSVVALNSLQIFDRWGDMVYFWDAPIPVDEWPGWDGTTRGDKVNPGVFVYYLEIALANGETVIKKGDVTVVR